MLSLKQKSLAAMVLAGALSISATVVSAATVTFSGLDTADLDALTPTSNATPTSSTPVFLDNVVGNQYDGGGTLIARSVWEGSTHAATGQFSSVQVGGSATFTWAEEQSSISMLWGSPDNYNDLTITLTSGGGGTFVVNGSDVQGPSGILASMVTISDLKFTSVLFESSTNAFEFANLTTTPVPLPAGMLLMGTAVAGFGVMRRLKNKKAA